MKLVRRYLRCHGQVVDLNDTDNWASGVRGRCGASIPTETDVMVWDGKTFDRKLGSVTLKCSLTVGSFELGVDLDEDIRQAIIQIWLNKMSGEIQN